MNKGNKQKDSVNEAALPSSYTASVSMNPFRYAVRMRGTLKENNKNGGFWNWYTLKRPIYSLLNWAILLCDVIPDGKTE